VVRSVFNSKGLLMWAWVRFPQKCCKENWGHSQPCVEVSRRSFLFLRRRSAGKQRLESGKRKRRKMKD